MNKPILILMGSDSDLPIVKNCLDTLTHFGVGYDLRVLSAHRTPYVIHDLGMTLDDSQYNVIIAAAGLSAHLAGVLASYTIKPVIGIPIEAGALRGVDALYSIVQMPSGVPVATMAIGKAGAVNAAVLAVQILSLSDAKLARLISQYKQKMADDVMKKDLRVTNPSITVSPTGPSFTGSS